jgi:parallel beta-helix repeat protein
MKTFIVTFIAFALAGLSATAQTNVSGGIYANTTWTLNNSPYIVDSTVVVFPGYTLTIEAGVTVKFDSATYLEIRQAQLIALGTITDSITFTSNGGNSAGFWRDVYLNGGTMISQFNYCNFLYGQWGIGASGINYALSIKNSKFISNDIGEDGGIYAIVDSCDFYSNTNEGSQSAASITHCNFINNNIGVQVGNNTAVNYCVFNGNQIGINSNTATILNSVFEYNQLGINATDLGTTIDNCIISNNQRGINLQRSVLKNCTIDSNSIVGVTLLKFGSFDGDSVYNCQINNNGIGIHDSLCNGNIITKNNIENNNVGIELESYQDTLYCNTICNNITYDLKYYMNVNTGCVRGNFWCTNDSATIETYIYDGYDNVSYGLVTFMPLDTENCHPAATGIPSIPASNSGITVFPNPATTILNIHTSQLSTLNSQLIITDLLGNEVYKETLPSIVNYQLSIVNWSAGLYFYEIRNNNASVRGKFVKE